jgi:serine/threonine-protein kinase
MKLIVAALAGILMMAGQLAAAEWGAIAHSPGTGANGFSYNWPNEVDAELTALNGCDKHANDCVTAVTFHDGCGALAVGRSGGWGADWGEDRAGAEWAALARCEDYDNGCRIRRWQCSR